MICPRHCSRDHIRSVGPTKPINDKRPNKRQRQKKITNAASQNGTNQNHTAQHEHKILSNMPRLVFFRWFVPDVVFQTTYSKHWFSNDLSQMLVFKRLVSDAVFQTICPRHWFSNDVSHPRCCFFKGFVPDWRFVPDAGFQTTCPRHCFSNDLSHTLFFKRFVPDAVFQTICARSGFQMICPRRWFLTICPRHCLSNDLSQTLFFKRFVPDAVSSSSIVRITCRNDLRITCRNDLANLFNMTLYNNHLKHTMTYLLKSQYNLQITDKHDINNGKILPRFPSPCQARSTRPRRVTFLNFWHFYRF